MTIKHVRTVGIGDTGEPADWNAAHTIDDATITVALLDALSAPTDKQVLSYDGNSKRMKWVNYLAPLYYDPPYIGVITDSTVGQYYAYGLPIKVQQDTLITGAEVIVGAQKSGNVIVGLYADLTGGPTGNPLASSASTAITADTDRAYHISFTSSYSVSAGVWWAVMICDNSTASFVSYAQGPYGGLYYTNVQNVGQFKLPTPFVTGFGSKTAPVVRLIAN